LRFDLPGSVAALEPTPKAGTYVLVLELDGSSADALRGLARHLNRRASSCERPARAHQPP
jgi:hypothetical protein